MNGRMRANIYLQEVRNDQVQLICLLPTIAHEE